MTREEFQKLTQDVVLLDGATGSNLMAAGMPRGICTEAWIMEHKEVLQNLQKAYVEAGSQIVYAPTFGGNRYSLGLHGLQDKLAEMNHALVNISREAVGHKVYVAGDITTTGKMMEPAGDLTYEMAYETYCEQIKVLEDAGVDLIAAETMINIEETLAAVDACQSVCELPIICTVTVEADGSIFRGLANSFFIMIAGTVVNMAFTTTLAYPLSKSNLKGRNVVLNVIIVTMLFSGGMIPNYLVVKGLGLLDSYWALMLPGAVNAFNLIIVKNFFQELPHELEEAARIDGCSDVGIFAKIILPLSKPALASVGLFYAVSHWNDFFNSLIYLNSTEKFPVQIILRQIVLLAQGASADGSAVDFGVGGTPPEQVVKMAATVVATIPILCVYPFVQKYFEQGVMVGAVKG